MSKPLQLQTMYPKKVELYACAVSELTAYRNGWTTKFPVVTVATSELESLLESSSELQRLKNPNISSTVKSIFGHSCDFLKNPTHHQALLLSTYFSKIENAYRRTVHLAAHR